VQVWASLAAKVAQAAEQAMQMGQTITARKAYMGQATTIEQLCFPYLPWMNVSVKT
jgi:hypothetical protein